MTYLSKACAALVIVQSVALEAEAQTPAKRQTVDELVNGILKEQDKKPNSQPASPPAGGGQPAPSRATGTAAPASLAEAVRAKIRPCWIPSGKTSPVVVAVRVEMNRDATPARAEVQDKTRYTADTTFRQVADAAVRSVMDSRCQPWPLPPEKYDAWRTITFNFDSRDY